MSTPWIPTPNQITDGQAVDASVVNPIFQQLVQREQYLYETLADLANKSVLINFNQLVSSSIASTVIPGNAVYIDIDANTSDATQNQLSLQLGLAAFGQLTATNDYQPNNSTYVVGLVKDTYVVGSLTYADVYTQGLCVFSNPITSFIDGNPTFKTGPLYLSRTNPGNLTYSPQGIAVFVGYAMDINTIHLRPNIHELAQYYINYNIDLLDRPAGTPVLNTGTPQTWSIADITYTTSDSFSSNVGWIPAATAIANGMVDPYYSTTPALFFYNLPANPAADTTISANEQAQSVTLKSAFPPIPTNFSVLTANGVVQKQRRFAGDDGVYAINDYGIWWYDNANGNQPWAQDVGAPSTWLSFRGTDVYRPRLNLSFCKLTPSIMNSVVTKLAVRNTPGVNNSTKAVQLLNSTVPANSATVGSLLLQYELPISAGTQLNQATAVGGNMLYSQVNGQLEYSPTPVISSINGIGGINVSMDGTGGATLSYNGANSGIIQDLEPINGDFQELGLNYYLLWGNTVSPTQGVDGSFTLPSNTPSKAILLKLLMFGDTSSVSSNIQLRCSYSVAAAGTVITSNSVTLPVTTAALSNYTAYTTFLVADANLTIPATAIQSDAIVNFRITRVIPSSNPYNYNVGLLGIYWEIV